MEIRNRAIVKTIKISDAQDVVIEIYHRNGKYIASINRRIREKRDGYESYLCYPFDAICAGIGVGRYSDGKLRKYAEAIEPHFNEMATRYLSLDMNTITEIERITFYTLYFWEPTKNV